MLSSLFHNCTVRSLSISGIQTWLIDVSYTVNLPFYGFFPFLIYVTNVFNVFYISGLFKSSWHKKYNIVRVVYKSSFQTLGFSWDSSIQPILLIIMEAIWGRQANPFNDKIHSKAKHLHCADISLARLNLRSLCCSIWMIRKKTYYLFLVMI